MTTEKVQPQLTPVEELLTSLRVEEKRGPVKKHFPFRETLNQLQNEITFTPDGQYVVVPTMSWRIARDLRVGENVQLGFNAVIEPGVEIGDNAKIGHNCTIEQDVVALDNLTMGDEVHLAPGTRLDNHVNIARRCETTGICFMGEHSKIRAGSTLSRAWIVEPLVFMGAGIMTSHTQHVNLGRPQMPDEQFLSRVGFGAIVGSGVQCGAGVEIGPGAVVGYNTFVPARSQLEQHGVYYNNPKPKATLQTTLQPENPLHIEIPQDCKPHYFTPAMLERYLKGYQIPDWLYELEEIGQEVMPGVLVPPDGWQQSGPLNIGKI